MKLKNDYFSNWLNGAMLPSEIFWLQKNILEIGCDLIIECGRQDGFSTLILGEFAKENNIKVLSIDFDDNVDKLNSCVKKLEGLPVECVSGDIHFHVPRLINEFPEAKICIIQDGPKGWEGMATLLASVFYDQVKLIAQHNLHVGHNSRSYFISIPGGDCSFLEDSKSADLLNFRKEEICYFEKVKANRNLDLTSLGIIKLDKNRKAAIKYLYETSHVTGYWSPINVFVNWQFGNFSFVSKLRKDLKYKLSRFKKR
jgi:hypothetical protein